METTTQSNQLVTEKEIVDVIYEAGQMPIKTLWRHFRGRMGRDFMAKVYAVAESEQYEEDGKTVTYIMLKAETIIKYGLATETCLYHYPSSSLWKIPDRHVVLPASVTLIASGDPHDPRWKTPDAGRDGPAALIPFNEIRESHLAILLFNGGEDYAKQCARDGRIPEEPDEPDEMWDSFETHSRGHPASTTISEEDARRERREWNRGAVRRGGGTDTGDGGTVCEQRRE